MEARERNVRYWPKADMAACTAHVRFWGKADMPIRRGCGMASRADAFRENAAACERRADVTTEPLAKKTFIDSAEQWRELARLVDDLDEGR